MQACTSEQFPIQRGLVPNQGIQLSRFSHLRTSAGVCAELLPAALNDSERPQFVGGLALLVVVVACLQVPGAQRHTA